MPDLLAALKTLDEQLPGPYGLVVELNGRFEPIKNLEIQDLGDFVSLGTKAEEPQHFQAVVIAKSQIALPVKSRYLLERETPEQRTAREENDRRVDDDDDDEDRPGWLNR